MKKIYSILFIIVFLAGCGKQAQVLPPLATSVPITMTSIPAETDSLPTATLAPAETFVPELTQDPTVFGAIGTGEIQAYALESVANAIFTRTMDGLQTTDAIQAYQVTSVTVFPGSNGLFAEIIYNVQTADPAWLADGGTQSDDGWIQGNCSRFDFFTTETEYQLKNRRLCG